MPHPLSSSRAASPQDPGRAGLLALATGAGLAAALLAYFGLARQTQGAGAQATRPVVVAACALSARCPLTMALLRVQRLPTTDAPPGSVTATEELTGQVTTTAIAAGEPVTRGMVTVRSALPGMAWAIAPSRRAVSVPLDAVSGVAGFLEPGDHVDVLATLESGSGQVVTRTILQNARLLAIGSRTEAAPATGGGEDKPATSATLEVTQTEAQEIAQSASHGKLQLTLRGLGDSEQASIAELPSAPVSVPPSPPARRPAADGTVGPPPAAPRPSVASRSKVTPSQKLALQNPVALHSPALPQIKVIRGTETKTVTVGE